MKKHHILFLAVLLVVFASVGGRASDIYIAQNAAGGSSGADCADAFALTFFNNSSNWASAPTSGKISPGTTVHLCGTFSAPAGANGYLVFQGSGTNGNPITLLFENGAVLTAPYWGGNGAIFANGVNYITINGGTNGTVRATANGTALTYQTNTYAVFLQSVSNSEVKNLTISNIYVHTANPSDEGGQESTGLQWQFGSNVTIDSNTCHDVRTCIRYAYQGSSTSSNINIYSNTVYNVNWGIILGDGDGNGILNGPVNIHNNVIHDFALWDDNANYNHHDGVYCFATNSGSSLHACSVYNNYIYGDPGTHQNTFIFDSQNNGGMSCTGVKIFNNILMDSSIVHFPANGLVQDWCTGTLIANNTFIGSSNANLSPQPTAISVNPGVGVTIENNIFSNFYHVIYLSNNGSATITAENNNDFYNDTYVGSDNSGAYYQTLANWQSCVSNGCPASHDAQSTAGNPVLGGSYHLSSSASAAWQKGINLTSLGITALDSDGAGNSRPSASPPNWDMGAYFDSGNAAKPAPPTAVGIQVVPTGQ